jgi:hemerythrin-like domain-containing protein
MERKSSNGRSKASRPQDAIALLKADHANVQAMFERFEKTRQETTKQELARRICDELTVHATIEEEIFYPEVREEIGDEDLMDEATVEHASAKDLIAQIRRMKAGDELFDAKVTVLGEYIKHHVKEEHTEMFPKARKSGVDLKELGARLADRKHQLGAK